MNKITLPTNICIIDEDFDKNKKQCKIKIIKSLKQFYKECGKSSTLAKNAGRLIKKFLERTDNE